MKNLKTYLLESMQNNAFVILKPGFLDKAGKFVEKLVNSGWRILRTKKFVMPYEMACDLYEMHADKDFYSDLCDYMSSDFCLCLTCQKDCDDPVADMKKIKDKIRDKWGIDDMKNAMHSSDSLENVDRETKIVFETK